MGFDFAGPLALQCRQITEYLQRHPLSSTFQDMPQLEKIAADTYRACCPTPMCLRTVTTKLKSQQHSSAGAWLSDINLIYDNAVRFNGYQSLIGGIALYLKGKAEKKGHSSVHEQPASLNWRRRFPFFSIHHPPISESLQCRSR
jgi:hypothetical protein